MTGSTDHFFTAFPTSGSGPGVLVLHPWWGLNPFIREFCQRLAAEGYIALAPDLYHGEIAATIPEAERLRSKMGQKQAKADLLAALDQLHQLPGVAAHPIGVIGFSLGASFALWLACERPQNIGAVVVFYGTRSGEFTNSKASFLGHFAETDEYESISRIKKLPRGPESISDTDARLK